MAKKKHTSSSQRWLDEHFEDEYVKKAKKLGFVLALFSKLKK